MKKGLFIVVYFISDISLVNCVLDDISLYSPHGSS
jgi:hypothetical protein